MRSLRVRRASRVRGKAVNPSGAVTATPITAIETPNNTTAHPSQTQQFAAPVANVAKKGVTWSLSLAVGSK